MSGARGKAGVCLVVLLATLLTVAAQPETDEGSGILEELAQIQSSVRLAMFLAKSALLSLSEEDVRINIEEISRLLAGGDSEGTGLIGSTERVLADVDAASLSFDVKTDLSSSLEHALAFLRDALGVAERIIAGGGRADEAELRALYAYLFAAHGDAELPTGLSGVEYSLSILPGAEVVVRAGESLQDAVDRVLPGGTVYVESGTYVLNDPLWISKSLTLTVAPDTTDPVEIVGPSGGRLRDAAITVAPEMQGQILHVRISGVSVSGGFYGIAIGPHVGATALIEGRIDVILDRVALSDAVQAGLSIAGLDSSVHLEDCRIHENGEFGIFGSQSARIDIEDSRIFDNGVGVEAEPYRITAGLYAIEESIVRVSKSVVEGNRGVGIRAEDTADLFVAGCTVSENTQGGLLVWDGVTLSLLGTRILRNDGWGLQFLSASCEPYALFVSHYFDGEVSGSGNTIPAPDDPDGNLGGSICPLGYESLLAP